MPIAGVVCSYSRVSHAFQVQGLLEMDQLRSIFQFVVCDLNLCDLDFE